MNNLSGRLGLESEKRSMTHHNCLTLRNRSPKKRISNEGREQSAGCCGCRFVDFASCDGLLPNGKHRSRTDSHPFAKSERKTESKHGVRPDKDCSRSRLPFSEPESRPAPLGEPVAIQTEENVLAAELINHLLIRSALHRHPSQLHPLNNSNWALKKRINSLSHNLICRLWELCLTQLHRQDAQGTTL